MWTPDQARQELKKRLDYAMDARKKFESRWIESERAVYQSSGYITRQFAGSSVDDAQRYLGDEIDSSSEAEVNISYVFKNLRFIHAQMSANPPSVVPRPTSSDQDDRRKADAADRLVRYAIRHYKMQERVDRASLNTLVYGTGFMKTVWDSNRGDILEFDPDTGEMSLEGDISISIPSTWNMWVDPDATTGVWEDVRYVFERVYYPFEEALHLFGRDKQEVLERCRIKRQPGQAMNPAERQESALEEEHYDVVEVYEYWETGLPVNGYVGRHAVCTRNGELLEQVRPSPFRFSSAGASSRIDTDLRLSDEQKQVALQRIPQKARLPYHIFTDIDIPNRVWGKSFIENVADLQMNMNRLDSVTLENAQAHAVARMVIPEGTEIADDSITNSPWDIVKITGSQPPHFISAPSLMPELGQMREQLRQGIDDLSGVNESMFGQQSREQSGFSMQYATNQGNMIRRRLFNKYVLFVEEIYKAYLSLVQKHWDTPRTIQVLGKEKAIEAVDIQSADIDGGFDLVVEYGTSLSLDPITRREEIMSLQPIFEKAGVPARVSLQMLKLNELEGMYDLMQLAEDRQREIFEEMIATGSMVEPEEFEDHENMIAYSLKYFMTTEFKYLDQDTRALLKQHTRLRTQVAAQEAAGGPGNASPAVQGAQPGMPPGGIPPAGPPAPEAAPAAGGPLQDLITG